MRRYRKLSSIPHENDLTLYLDLHNKDVSLGENAGAAGHTATLSVGITEGHSFFNQSQPQIALSARQSIVLIVQPAVVESGENLESYSIARRNCRMKMERPSSTESLFSVYSQSGCQIQCVVKYLARVIVREAACCINELADFI